MGEQGRAAAQRPFPRFGSRSVEPRPDRRGQASLGEILRLRPDYSRRLVEASFPYRHRDDLERYLEGLRKAGLPD